MLNTPLIAKVKDRRLLILVVSLSVLPALIGAGQAMATTQQSITIEQTTGTTTSDELNTTRMVSFSSDTALAFDSGTNYRIQLTNEDTGDSVTVSLSDEVTVSADTSIALSMYRPDGTPKANPQAWVVGDGFYDVEIVSGSIPTASGSTDFSVTLRNADDDSAIAETDTRPSVVGYRGVASQNSTSGQIQVSLPRDSVPETATAELGIWQDGERDQITFVPMTYDGATDHFVAVLDASEYESGNYSWDIGISEDEWQILQVRSPNSANSYLSIEGGTDSQSESDTGTTDGVSLTQQSGTTTSDRLNSSRQVTVTSNTELTFDNGNNYYIQLTNDESGESVTVSIADSVTVPADTRLSLMFYAGSGNSSAVPQIWAVGDGFYDVEIVSGSIPSASGLTDFSVTLLDANDRSTVAATDSRPSIVGYSGVASQNSTDGRIRVSLPRDNIPETTSANLTVWPDGQRDDTTTVSMVYDDEAAEFFAILDAGNFASGNYSWDIGLSDEGWQVLQVRSPNSANEFLRIGGGDGTVQEDTETEQTTESPETESPETESPETATESPVTATETATPETESPTDDEVTDSSMDTDSSPSTEQRPANTTVTGTVTAGENATVTTAADGPGFGVIVTLVAVLAVAMGLGRRS